MLKIMISEKQLEDFIFYTDKTTLSDLGLDVDSKIKRQVKIGKYGIADMISVKKDRTAKYNIPFLHFTIYELKKDKIDIHTFLQSIRYAMGLKHFLSKVKNIPYDEYKITLKLIGRQVNLDNSFMYLQDLLVDNEFDTSSLMLDLYTYSVEGDVILFNRLFTNFEELNILS